MSVRRANEVLHRRTTQPVTLTPPSGSDQNLPVQLISPGHFVGDTTLTEPGRWRLRVDGPGASVTFAFTLRKGD